MGTIATNVYSENFTRSIVKLEAVDEQESVESFDAESSVYDSANSSIYYSQSLVNIDNIVSHYEHYSEDEASSASIQDMLWLDDGNEDCKHDSESDSGPATPTDDRASVAAPQLPSQLDVKKPATLCDQAIQTEPFTVYPPGFVEDQRQQQTEQLSLANLRSMILNLPPTFSPTDPKPVDLVCRRCRGIRLVAVPYDQSRDDSGSHRSNASSLGDSRPLNLEDSCLGRRPSVRIKVVSAKPGEGDGNLSPLLVGASRGGQPLVNGRPGSTIIPIRSSMSLSPASANSMLARLASPSSSGGGGRLSPGTAPGTVGRYGSLGSVNPRAARGRRTSSNATAIPLSGLFSDKGLRATCSETPVPTPMVASVKDSDQPHHQQQPQKSQKAHLNEIESTHTKSPALECSEPHSKPQRKDCNEESAARYEPPERGNKYSPPHPVDLDARANMAPPTTLGEERRDTRFSYTASPSLGRSGSSRKFLPRTPPPPPPVYSPSKQQASKYRQPDPLVVQAIARTMVGSFMWKYTSSSMLSGNITGGSSRPSNHRERRHLRYFWIHPYAKMLNWNRYPPSGNVSLSMRMRSQGTRSAFIRSVRIVPDLQAGRSNDDASPRHCIIITTNKKEVKIKATSPQDHEQWVMAMNYLQAQPVFTSNAYAAPLAIVAEPERPEPRTVLATEGERDLGSKHVDYNTFSQPQAPLQLDSNRGRHTHTHSYQRPPPLPRQSHGPSTTHIFSGHPVSMAAVNIYRRPATSHQRTISNDEFKVGRGASLPRPSTAVASTTPKRSAVSSLFKASGGILRRKLMTQYDQASIHSPPSATKLPTRAGSNTDIDDSRRCGHTAVSPAGKPSPAFFGDSGNKPPISFMSSPRQRPTSSPATPEGYVRVSHGVRWSPNARSPDPSTTTPTQRMRKRLGISMMRMFGAKFDEQLPASPPLTSLGLRNVGSQFEPMITTTMPQNSTNMHV
ncbi:hypothetical protein EV182_001045 [Spiromyces aspiralis]|uniref:Uncharacterized protein n=1 Tax=Spiromyces aspiralis TaxID=68401 RepID=A0ACC1HG58_9FUNG|nr:hypothetical protein EV182_001045 [Spiromyces aspiralis]